MCMGVLKLLPLDLLRSLRAGVPNEGGSSGDGGIDGALEDDALSLLLAGVVGALKGMSALAASSRGNDPLPLSHAAHPSRTLKQQGTRRKSDSAHSERRGALSAEEGHRAVEETKEDWIEEHSKGR